MGPGSGREQPTARGRQPIAWTILGVLTLTKLGLHLLSNGWLAYGYMSDELYPQARCRAQSR